MDPQRFDQLSRRFAQRRLTRRHALRWVGPGGLVAGLLAAGGGAAAAPGTPPAGDEMAANNATLFVQTAASGTFTPNPQAGQPLASPTSAPPAATGAGTPTAAQHGAYRLTLHGHSGETIYFSDRPQRTFGEVKTPHFISSMGFTPVNPPNAALVVDTPAKADDILLVELLNPTYDAGTQTLTYEADLLPQYQGEVLQPLARQQQDQTIAAHFDSASLFIDDCPDTSIFCYTLEGWLRCTSMGTVNQVGTCWHYLCLCCTLCSGSPLDYCEQAFPTECTSGNCVGKTIDEVEQQCGRG